MTCPSCGRIVQPGAAFKFLAVCGAGCYLALVWWVTRLQEQRFADR